MKRVVGVVGYKNSGKTTLVRALAGALVDRGRRVAVIKHTSHRVDLAEKDTAALLAVSGEVAIVSAQATALFWQRAERLEGILTYLEADLVLVEGFKDAQTYPKIVCLRGQPDDGDLFDGLTIAAVGKEEDRVADGVPLFDRNDVEALVDLVLARAFKLPRLDCGGCGYETCYQMARQIVAGRNAVEDCVSLLPPVRVAVAGRPLAINPFIANIVRNTIVGLLSTLKGFREGKIEIEI